MSISRSFFFANKLCYLWSGFVLPIQLQSSSAQSPEDSHASSSDGPVASSNGNVAHAENGQTTAESEPVYGRTTTIVIDPETGEARNAITGETMELPLHSPRTPTTAPPPVPIAELQHLATESDLQVCKPIWGFVHVVHRHTLRILTLRKLVCFSWFILS